MQRKSVKIAANLHRALEDESHRSRESMQALCDLAIKGLILARRETRRMVRFEKKGPAMQSLPPSPEPMRKTGAPTHAK
jgi:hypothetical protein